MIWIRCWETRIPNRRTFKCQNDMLSMILYNKYAIKADYKGRSGLEHELIT